MYAYIHAYLHTHIHTQLFDILPLAIVIAKHVLVVRRGLLHTCIHTYLHTYIHTHIYTQLFEILPLATVVAKQAFVVHGGLCRIENVRIDDIRAINRRRQCPVNIECHEDALMFDCKSHVYVSVCVDICMYRFMLCMYMCVHV
jgi:diadenosine tetraphosphatase ApaH/serine/threonine PP2A family protein phosphatase